MALETRSLRIDIFRARRATLEPERRRVLGIAFSSYYLSEMGWAMYMVTIDEMSWGGDR